MTLFEDWPHHWFGFWKNSAEEWGQVPLFYEVVDESWSPQDFQQLLDYLQKCPISLASGVQTAQCDLCGSEFRDCSAQQSDGTWVWPKTLEHYVREHNVRLPDSMVEHIRRRNYEIPTLNSERS